MFMDIVLADFKQWSGLLHITVVVQSEWLEGAGMNLGHAAGVVTHVTADGSKGSGCGYREK